VLLAYRCALAAPNVSATAIEATEFPALADEKDVWAVPKIVVDGVPQYEGAVHERVFVQRLIAPVFE
jgi:predicted thioredoxin/glutaredoxin